MRNAKIKEFHTLLNLQGVTEDGKRAILSAYDVASTKELSLPQLSEICDKLHLERQKAGLETKPRRKKTPVEVARSQVKVAVGKWLAARGEIAANGWGLTEWNKITGVACRAAKESNFNAIPLSKLRGIIYEFNKQREAMETTAEYVKESV